MYRTTSTVTRHATKLLRQRHSLALSPPGHALAATTTNTPSSSLPPSSSSSQIQMQTRSFGKKTCGTDVKGSFPMPDQDTELKLAKIQTTISDHYKRGDFTKALHASEELLKQTEEHFGNKHPATASAYNNIGLMQKLLGDFVNARQNYNTAMRIYGQVVGRDHGSYAMTLHNLGALNKSQVHFDTSLKATERLSLVETALEYFEEAWAIRKAELGEDHPNTVATRSSYGSTLAAQVLHQHKYVEQKKTTQQGATQQQQQYKKYVSLNSTQVTERGWKAAEEHLREALATAISSPRGRQVTKKNTKKKKKGTPSKSKNNNTNNNKNDSDDDGLQNLSAAAAAQGLAVFLKSRAMTEDPYNVDMLNEAKKLYTQVQSVRSQLLPAEHPELYATKHSLAELLEVMGDEEAANVLRQEIIDTYDPPEAEEGDDAAAVVVETTTTTTTTTASSSSSTVKTHESQ